MELRSFKSKRILSHSSSQKEKIFFTPAYNLYFSFFFCQFSIIKLSWKINTSHTPKSQDNTEIEYSNKSWYFSNILFADFFPASTKVMPRWAGLLFRAAGDRTSGQFRKNALQEIHLFQPTRRRGAGEGMNDLTSEQRGIKPPASFSPPGAGNGPVKKDSGERKAAGS